MRITADPGSVTSEDVRPAKGSWTAVPAPRRPG